MRRKSQFKILATALIVCALAFAGTPAVAGPKSSQSKSKSKGKASHVLAIVVNPAGLTTQDPALTISQDETDGVPGSVKVRSSATGTDHWIHLPFDLPAGVTSGKGRTHPLYVVGVEVCHQEIAEVTPPPTSFIDTLRLTKLESPMGSEIEHEDETDLFSELSECAQSPVPFPFPIEGAVTLSLNLAFEKLDDAFCFGAIRILLAGNPAQGMSEPSEPSIPSEPSAPSAPSEPSTPSSPSLPNSTP
jgi:hypothetical protein